MGTTVTYPNQPPPNQPPPQYQQQPYGPPPVVVKKRKVWPWVLLVAVLLPILGFVACAALVTTAVNEVGREVSVHYEVTGDAADVTISYSSWNGGNMSSSTETAATLPWTKDFKASGFGKGGTLTVTTGAEGGTATCKVVVDGKENEATTSTASGQFAIATCSGF